MLLFFPVVEISRFLGSLLWRIYLTKFLFLPFQFKFYFHFLWSVQFPLMCPMQMSALVSQITMFVPVYEHTCFTCSFVTFITWVDGSWHVGRRRNLNAGNWAKTLLFLPPVQIIYHLLHNAGGGWLSPAESLWDGLANQAMVGRSASFTDRKWCN